jgi:sialate O-acetylesterase
VSAVVVLNQENKKPANIKNMNRIFLLTAVLILLLNGGCNIYMYNSTERYNLEPIVTLEGDWKFNIGDDPTWASKSYDDSTWDKIYVPSDWQDQGYHQYLGYAWYRTKVFIPRIDESDNIYLYIDAIDDVSEVYINGILIGQTGNFPPNYKTAYNIPVFYSIPQSLINYDGENTLAIRVYNDQMDGGIVSGPAVIGYFEDDVLLNQNLAGMWQFKPGFNRQYTNADYDASNWQSLFVPGPWDNQGYLTFDGVATYRTKFTLANGLEDEELYLILGIIDDKDKVYLNGKLIAKTEDMYGTELASNGMGEWQVRRAYKIPAKNLNYSGSNTLVVVVNDDQQIGGIVTGPIGIMTKSNYDEYVSRYKVKKVSIFQILEEEW